MKSGVSSKSNCYCGNLKTRRHTAGIAVFSRTKSAPQTLPLLYGYPYICSYNSSRPTVRVTCTGERQEVLTRTEARLLRRGVAQPRDWNTRPTPTVGARHLSPVFYQSHGFPLLSQRSVGRVAPSLSVGAHLGYSSRASMQRATKPAPRGLAFVGCIGTTPRRRTRTGHQTPVAPAPTANPCTPPCSTRVSQPNVSAMARAASRPYGTQPWRLPLPASRGRGRGFFGKQPAPPATEVTLDTGSWRPIAIARSRHNAVGIAEPGKLLVRENGELAPGWPPCPRLHRKIIPFHPDKLALLHAQFAKMFVKRRGIRVGAPGGKHRCDRRSRATGQDPL